MSIISENPDIILTTAPVFEAYKKSVVGQNWPLITIIEGIDNVGKGTLIDGLIAERGFHQIIKFDKPRKSSAYDKEVDPLKAYQEKSFKAGWNLIQGATSPKNPAPLIFDRFHLGEMVYSPIYRGYSGDYVFEQERHFLACCHAANTHVRLVLLVADDFELLEDDGKSFDHSKVEIEQKLFLDAFNRSALPKKIVRVHEQHHDEIDDFFWRPKESILKEVLDFVTFD